MAFLAIAPSGVFAADVSPYAMEIKGIGVPATVEIAGKKLVLNGAGLRTKMIFKVYVGALFLERKTSSAAEIISQDKARRMELTFLRNLDSGAITDAVEKGFARNPAFPKKELDARLANFRKLIADLKKSDRLSFTYVPGEGLDISCNGKSVGSVPGKDFADALFAVWLGDSPADKNLRRALLDVK